MSLVGPRPNLFNQHELIEARDKFNIYSVLPGITGLAQNNNIDMSTPDKLANTDAEMIKTLNITNYFKYIIGTVSGRGQGDGIKRK
jgi:lipopolysaccharide/colanic/teichoic acid biosynthesis glycosyltransferase